jgi:hemoglobin
MRFVVKAPRVQVSLCDRLGGRVAVVKAATYLCAKASKDARIRRFFDLVLQPNGNLYMDQLQAAVAGLLLKAFSGKEGQAAAAADLFHLLCAHTVDDSHCDALIEHLEEALAEQSLPPTLIGEAVAVADSARETVLRSSTTQRQRLLTAKYLAGGEAASASLDRKIRVDNEEAGMNAKFNAKVNAQAARRNAKARAKGSGRSAPGGCGCGRGGRGGGGGGGAGSSSSGWAWARTDTFDVPVASPGGTSFATTLDLDRTHASTGSGLIGGSTALVLSGGGDLPLSRT